MMLSGTVTAKAGTETDYIYYSGYDCTLYIEAYCESSSGGGSTILYDEDAMVFVHATHYYTSTSANPSESSISDYIDDEGYATVCIEVAGWYSLRTETEHSVSFFRIDAPKEVFSLTAYR